MNKKALKVTLLNYFTWPDKEMFFIFSVTIISFILSFYGSNYFYFLSIPVLLFDLQVLRLSIKHAYNDYLRYCKNEDYMSNGTHTIKKENGKYIVNLVNGKRHGSFIEYYRNGQIKKDCNYINGKRHGFYKTYYDNGNLKNQLHYNNDTLDEDERFHSFYDNKAKYREGNFGENGLVKEYFKNGNLKFLKDKNKYTFYDEDNNLKCETHIEDSNSFFGKWKNYREYGTIEYELDFDDSNSDKVTNKVVKTIFTKGGEFFSKNVVTYNKIKMAEVNFFNSYAGKRMEESVYKWDTGMRGPPGVAYCSVNLKPISSIEDIIKFL